MATDDEKQQERPEPIFQTRIFIERDGTVVIENLAEELLPLVQALDPDGELGLACRTPDGPAPTEPELHKAAAESAGEGDPA